MSRGAVSLVMLVLALAKVGSGEIPSEFSRADFPPEFVFGAGTSAYQFEGAVAVDGRTPSIWDTFTHAGKIKDGSTADIASDGYHRYKEDIRHMSNTGLEAYRFSISWSRLMPNGRGAINPKGVEYYNSVINELVKYGIQPHVTLYHLDLPQVLEDEYEGWLSPKIVGDFTAYADVCFREFGDRVTHWTTINEANVIAKASYDTGLFPPRRCSQPFGMFNCTAGNSTVEPYIVLHNLLLAHATVFKLYRTKYQAQHGWVGINVYTYWCSPLTNSTADIEATQRALDFLLGWVLNPLVFGDYPGIIKKRAGSRIPSFTNSQSELVKGSFDFIGINHYTSMYIGDNSNPLRTDLRDLNADMSIVMSAMKNGTPSPQVCKPLWSPLLSLNESDMKYGNQFVPTKMPSDPIGLQNMLEYLQRVYGNPPVYVQENGYAMPANSTMNDTARVDFLKGYIGHMLSAIRNGANTRGYFIWSFLDVFEFLAGYQARFGLYHVNFEGKNLKRQPKFSVLWYRDFLKQKVINIQRDGRGVDLHSPS